MNVSSNIYHFNDEKIKKETVMISLAKKDPSKFDSLYNYYHEQIFLFVLKRVESEDTAADITSQVFLKALLNIKKYNDHGLPFASWLYRIARNEIYNQYHQNKITMVVSMESDGIRQMISEFGEEKQEEDFSRLHAALKTLSEGDIEYIELRFFEKRHFKEIAEILGITENNAKVKTYRILEKLKKTLNNER